MAFHLDLDNAADCDRWREMLRHEQAVEQRSVGALAGPYHALPPRVRSSFLTHRHTHARLLPDEDQRDLQQAIDNREFTFVRSPSRAHPQGSLNGAQLHSLTHGDQATAHTPRTHLPTDARLEYLFPPDHMDRMQLYPRSATSYERGPHYDSRLAPASLNPHPSWKRHADTSTYRRVTTGRRHNPFPAQIRGIRVVDNAHHSNAGPPPQEEKEDASSYRTPPQPIHAFTPAAPGKPRPLSQAALSPAPFPHLTPVASGKFQLTPLPHASTRSPSPPHAQSARLGTSAASTSPGPFGGAQTTRVSGAAQVYTRRRVPSSSALTARASSPPAASSSPLNSTTHGDRTGFADAQSMYSAPARVQPLIQQMPTKFAHRSFAHHSHDHTPSFGTRGVFQAVPTTAADQLLHASHRLW